ncbi:MAG: hypothetical protein NT013_01535 [Planctomycetia bacterium]|nr:hypothetical protein [Planctomycetia bacterium]
MTKLWRKLRDEESGFLISSELVIVGTVGVLAMVVGLEAISSSVIQELNDLASAFGAMSQSYNYRSIAKIGHARISGAGYNDRGDYCDCTPIVQTEVGGKLDAGGTFSESFSSPGVVQEQLVVPPMAITAPPAPVMIAITAPPAPVMIQDKVIAAPCVTCTEVPGEIIEERIIRRRIGTFSDCSSSPATSTSKTIIVPQPESFAPTLKAPPVPKSNVGSESYDPKPKKKK